MQWPVRPLGGACVRSYVPSARQYCNSIVRRAELKGSQYSVCNSTLGWLIFSIHVSGRRASYKKKHKLNMIVFYVR